MSVGFDSDLEARFTAYCTRHDIPKTYRWILLALAVCGRVGGRRCDFRRMQQNLTYLTI